MIACSQIWKNDNIVKQKMKITFSAYFEIKSSKTKHNHFATRCYNIYFNILWVSGANETVICVGLEQYYFTLDEFSSGMFLVRWSLEQMVVIK